MLWSKILESSLWVQESKETRLLWVTMLAMKNRDGIIQASVVGLADRAKISAEECRKSLVVLLSADPNDTSGVENGKRIREIPGGWEIVNHNLYRFSTEAKRAFWADEKAKQRAKEPKKKLPSRSQALPRERRYGEALVAGDQAGADRIAAEGLPAGRVEPVEIPLGEPEPEE